MSVNKTCASLNHPEASVLYDPDEEECPLCAALELLKYYRFYASDVGFERS